MHTYFQILFIFYTKWNFPFLGTIMQNLDGEKPNVKRKFCSKKVKNFQGYRQNFDIKTKKNCRK